jgi:hypothetical protein
MQQLAEIASYSGNPPTNASIMVFDGLFLSVSNRFWFCSAQEMVTVISRPPGPRAFGFDRYSVISPEFPVDASGPPIRV